ncbi:MAG: four helix bundle protein [Herpetosiphon sp.]|nr:four helix bundle protein [Herpetosiphon sp.]
MKKIQSHEDLLVWQRAMDLVTTIYTITRSFPDDERFGLTNQIRRAVTSIAANIAEGHGRLSQADYLRFLSIARGSLMEVRTFLRIAERLMFISNVQSQPLWVLADETGRLLNGLIRSLKDSGIRDEPAEYRVDDIADTESA